MCEFQHSLSQKNKIFKYIINIIIDILILITTIRNLHAYFISHYSVNIMFSGLYCKRDFQQLQDVLSNFFILIFKLMK